jgi:hypothetical protein
MTKLHNQTQEPSNKRRNNNRNRRSRIAQENKPRTNEYYSALINTTLYDPRLGSEEAHNSRHKARIEVLHSEDRTLAQEAAKDLRLHSRSLVTRRVTSLNKIKSIPSLQKVPYIDLAPKIEKWLRGVTCSCLLVDLICLERCKKEQNN